MDYGRSLIMDSKQILRNSNFCRLCAEENLSGTDIFTVDENSLNLQQIINKYLPIVVEKDDYFPQKICSGCHIQLEEVKLFMDLIVSGQKQLREKYKKYQAEQARALKFEETLNNFANSPLYLVDHQLRLNVEGLDKPKRKRGRPAKKVITEEKEVIDEHQDAMKENKEEEEEIGADGRRKRRVRAPARYDGLVQGKELDEILKKEGIVDEDVLVKVTKNIGEIKKYSNGKVIGRIQGESREDLGIPIFIKRTKAKTANFAKGLLKKFECNICSKKFIYEFSFNNHMKSHENEDLHISMAEKGDSPVFLDKHESTTSAESQKIITTDEISQANTNECQENENQEKLSNNCMTCDKSFPSHEILELHMKKHTDSKKFTCEICGKMLSHPSSLLYHKTTEHNNQRFVCNKCDKSFKHKQLLQRHQFVHTEERPFICPVCKAAFKTHANLVNHETVHSGEKKFKCLKLKCDQRFAHKTSLSLHQRWHTGKKPFTCEYCQKSFSQNGNLIEHKRIHTKEKPFSCDICKNCFTTSSQLRIHGKVHTGEKPWKCEICEKRFLHRDTYKYHVNRHLNYRPYVCQTCNSAFSHPFSLKKHERIHTGEKLFACEVCGKSFSDKSNKQKHMKIHKVPDDDSKLGLNIVKNELQLTQLVDQQGNPISITTQDGQTVPVITSGDDDSNIQGLLPDGTLIAIEIATIQEKDFNEEIPESTTLDLLESTTDTILEESLEDNPIDDLSSNFQLLTNNSGNEVCLVTYSIEEDGALTQELVLESALVEN